MSIVFHCNWSNKKEWISSFKNKFKNNKIHIWPNISNYKSIKYAIVWDMPTGVLKKFTNLKIIFSLGAGVDHIFKDPELPKIPIIRLKDPIMAERMFNYCYSHILNFQLKKFQYANSQKIKQWRDELECIDNNQLKIGILGIGFLGNYIAKLLYKKGYKIQGFKRSKTINNKYFPVYYLKKDLKKFISTSDVILNILPNTLPTKNYINKNFLQNMKKKSLLINVGRGETLDENDLILHLKNNPNFLAVLDVFKKEPLPKKHPFWRLKNVIITPHIASITNITSAVNQIYQIYILHKKKRKLKNLVNNNMQY